MFLCLSNWYLPDHRASTCTVYGTACTIINFVLLQHHDVQNNSSCDFGCISVCILSISIWWYVLSFIEHSTFKIHHSFPFYFLNLFATHTNLLTRAIDFDAPNVSFLASLKDAHLPLLDQMLPYQ